MPLLQTKIPQIILYALFILSIAVLILAIAQIFAVKHCYKPQERLVMPVECLKYSDSVNSMLDSMGIKAVRAISPDEFAGQTNNRLNSTSRNISNQ